MAKRDPIAFDQTFTLDENNDVAIAFEASISVNAQRNIARLASAVFHARSSFNVSGSPGLICSPPTTVLKLVS